MAEFLYVYRNTPAHHTPEEMQQQMTRWMSWMKELGAQIKHPGHPLEFTGKVVAGKNKVVTDGPFAEKDLVSGFTIVEAKDIDHAVELSRGCPIFHFGGAVEVRPIMKM